MGALGGVRKTAIGACVLSEAEFLHIIDNLFFVPSLAFSIKQGEGTVGQNPTCFVALRPLLAWEKGGKAVR